MINANNPIGVSVNDDRDNTETGGDKIITVLLEDSKQFNIGDKKFEFSDQDPIFFLDKPTPKKEYLTEKGLCFCCNVSFKSVKSVAYW